MKIFTIFIKIVYQLNSISMKKINLLLFTFLLVFSCSSDDDSDSSPSNPTNFYEAHVGVWITTFSENSQLLLNN